MNILIVGVGGQGVIMASDILADVALAAGFDAKKSEVHGMSQRGGIVSSHVRYGDKIYSPLIAKGQAEILISFELAEALRWQDYLTPTGQIIVSRIRLVPPVVTMGMAEYPDQAEKHLAGAKPIVMDALAMAAGLGNPRLVNTILLGIASNFMDLPLEKWNETIRNRVKSELADINCHAFAAGRKAETNIPL
ncbi:MAG: indolepyruvate oxidoreductase subunit beta [Desulfovibrionaceae bacterium]|nr:indolepyruvate oxidoreductase subunit beta [Desulfovibrionaceae bacterium]